MVVKDKNCALRSYYAASSGNFLLMFRDNLSAPSSGVENPSGGSRLQIVPLQRVRDNRDVHPSASLFATCDIPVVCQ